MKSANMTNCSEDKTYKNEFVREQVVPYVTWMYIHQQCQWVNEDNYSHVQTHIALLMFS